MYPALFSVDFPDTSSRILLIFRPVLIIPLLFWSLFYGMAAGFVQFLSFWSILFTGSHPRTLWSFLERFLRFRCRTNAYMLLLTDAYPPFSGDGEREYPVDIHIRYPERISRMTVLFRLLILIPHFFFAIGYAFIIGFVQFLAFWTVLFTGRLTDWLFTLLEGWFVYTSRLDAYMLYLVDEYPPFNGAQPRAADEFFA